MSHGHLDHFGGAAKIQEASGARVVAAEEDWKLIEQVGSRPGRAGGPPPRVPKRDMVVKEGDTLTLGGQTLKFHQTPGHTPGVLHSWAGDNGYPGGGVLERGMMLKSRKPGNPHPFVDPATFTHWVTGTQDGAASAVQQERQKAGR